MTSQRAWLIGGGAAAGAVAIGLGAYTLFRKHAVSTSAAPSASASNAAQLAAPQGVQVTVSDGVATVTWDTVSGATTYRVREVTASGQPTGVQAVTPDTLAEFSLSGTTYFQVAACNASVCGPWSATVQATYTPSSAGSSSSSTSATSTSSSSSSSATVPAPTASDVTLSEIAPSSVSLEGTLSVQVNVALPVDTPWELVLSVQDLSTGATVASFPPVTGSGPMLFTLGSSAILHAQPGDLLALVGTLSTPSGQVQINSGPVSTVTTVSTSSSATSSPTQPTNSPQCQQVFEEYNRVYQLFQQARFAYAANPTTQNLNAINAYAAQLENLQLQYAALSCPVPLP